MAKSINVYNRFAWNKTETIPAHTIAGEWAIAKTVHGYKAFHLPTGLGCPIMAPWTVARGRNNEPRLKDAKRVLELVQSVPTMDAPEWGGTGTPEWLDALKIALKIQHAEIRAERDAKL